MPLRPPLTRRRALMLSLLLPLAACGEEAPPAPVFEPANFEYLTPLRLKVGKIDIDDGWAPSGEARHVEFLAPTTPRAALRTMAEQRLIAAGGTGSALFRITDASIIRRAGRYMASFAVRLTLLDGDGNELAHITARAAHVRPVGADDSEGVRADLYELVRATMRDMNVEFEYQIRRTLGRWLEATEPSAPAQPVQAEDLGKPGTEP